MAKKKQTVQLHVPEVFIIAAALRYTVANLGDVNNAFRDEEEEDIVKVEGGDLYGTEIGEGEAQALAETMVATAIIANK